MSLIFIIIVAALVFSACALVDRLFTAKFRGKAQHRSGMAVRVSKQYGVFGVALSVLGVLAIGVGITGGMALMICGLVVFIMGICLAVYYLTHGIFYDGESFLVASFRKKDQVYRYDQILEQKLFLVQGGNVIIELYLEDGNSVSLQSSMVGVYLFLDTAFAGWCMQKGLDPQACDFHDPSKSWWFPHEEEAN